jgi:hypothetical protein
MRNKIETLQAWMRSMKLPAEPGSFLISSSNYRYKRKGGKK